MASLTWSAHALGSSLSPVSASSSLSSSPSPPSSSSYPDFHWIVDGLALGNVRAGTTFDTLQQAGIDVLVIALPTLPRHKLAYVHQGVSFLHVPVQDHPAEDLSRYFGLVFDFIDGYLKAGRRVLVHCHAGISRSTTLLVAFLMRRYQWTRDQALQWVKQQRSIIAPNPGFAEQLLRWEQQVVKSPGSK